MAAAQPEFLAAYKAGSVAAHNATCKSGDGNESHTAVKHWGKFCLHGLRINMVRPLDATTTTLFQKLGELDLVEAFAWWLVTQVNVNTETAWNYVCVMNSWHHRATGVHIAAGFPLLRIKSMLDGMQRLTNLPIPRLKRIGIRPARLHYAINTTAIRMIEYYILNWMIKR